MRVRLGWVVVVTLLVLLAATVGFALGAQVQRFTRCQQLSAQYVAAIGMSVPDGLQPTFKSREINAARAAYQGECGLT